MAQMSERVRVTPQGTLVTDVATPDAGMAATAGLTSAQREAAQESIRGFATDLAQRRATLMSLQKKGAIPPPDVMPTGQIAMSPEALAQRARAANWGQEAVFGMRGTGGIADPVPPFASIMPDSTVVTKPYMYVPYRATGIPISLDSAHPRMMLFTPHQQSRWHPFTSPSLTKIPPQPAQPLTGKGGTLFPWGGDRGLSSGGGNLLTRTPVDAPPIPGGVGTRLVTRPSGLVVPTGQALAGFAGQSARQVAQDPSAQIETVQHFNQPTGVETGLDIGQVQREGLGETVIGDASIFSPQPQPTSPKVEIKDAVIEPVRKPQVDDPIIIDIFERPIETEFPASPKIVEPEIVPKVETEIKPAVIEDASIFRPQPQPTSAKVDEEVIKQLPPADGPQQKPRLSIRFPDEERRKVPNTGGGYPATVVHRADVIVTTDLDTGEHTAALVELKGEPQGGSASAEARRREEDRGPHPRCRGTDRRPGQDYAGEAQGTAHGHSLGGRGFSALVGS